MKNGIQIVDFRVRPPLPPFKVLYDLKLMRLKWENQFTVAVANATAPSMYKVGQTKGLDLLTREMDEAGVDYIVVPGRKISAGPAAVAATGTKEMVVSDETLLGLQKSFDNRAFGLHGLDLSLPTDQLVAGLEQAVTKHGLRGAVMEPAYFAAPDGGALTADNKKLYPNIRDHHQA
jgi:predicted TIM-barrel fold metal-dependent hydrolase